MSFIQIFRGVLYKGFHCNCCCCCYSYQQNEQHEESVRDWKKLYENDKSAENRQSLKEADKLLKMSKRKDYYKILGIEKTAGDTDIKKAYRKKAMLHHPGKLYI